MNRKAGIRPQRREPFHEGCKLFGTDFGKKGLGDLVAAQELRIIPIEPGNLADRHRSLQMQSEIVGVTQLGLGRGIEDGCSHCPRSSPHPEAVTSAIHLPFLAIRLLPSMLHCTRYFPEESFKRTER